MIKNKLIATYDFDFDLVGIVCNKKEYKLAWYLNGALGIELSKQKDIEIEFSKSLSILISAFKYETEFICAELLRNRLVSGGNQPMNILMPELKQFDYLFKFRDVMQEFSVDKILDIIKKTSLIEYAVRLNFDNLKSKENLLY